MQNGATNSDEPGLGVEYQDTVALLQEEVAHLEEEVRLRDEALAERSQAPAPPDPSGDQSGAQQLAELKAELERRDEMVALLLDELRIVEEAEAAGRAEWEQLDQWLGQVEQRVDSRDRDESNIHEELAAALRETDVLQQAAQTEKQAWDKQRKTQSEEIERLRTRLSLALSESDPGAKLALVELEAENNRLRNVCDELACAASSAEQAERLRAELRILTDQLTDSQSQIRSLEDDLERERKEHEAALSALRSQLAIKPLARGLQPAGAASRSATSEISVDERIRAFRQHLQQVHQQELEERTNRRLSGRISRLWRRTGPTP